MAFSTTARNAAIDALRALMSAGTTGFLSLHTADPGATGASEVTGTGYARTLGITGTTPTSARDITCVIKPVPTRWVILPVPTRWTIREP